ncbi:class I SAM-dependent methyltransferase [Tuwongella immobilis]|uniref:Methyltransferase domain-containing protein n=1 Tax=Tuwongella immobilis TaxID=692036 RepID=A0A6C2YS96_9BACT
MDGSPTRRQLLHVVPMATVDEPEQTDSRDADLWYQLLTRETLRPLSRKVVIPEPLTPEWFALIEEKRYARHGAWMHRLLEFHKHPGERVLALGDGLGTDWIQYARQGAHCIVCSESQVGLAHVRRNFECRGLVAQFVHTPSHQLPFEPETVDVVSLSGDRLERVSPEVLLPEIFRVLKPGGKVIATLPAQNDAYAWERWALPWRNWLPFWKNQSAARASQLRFNRRQVTQLFADFAELKIYQRHLRRSELPHLWRPLPLPLMERLMGRFLVVKAYKPLTAAMRLTQVA